MTQRPFTLRLNDFYAKYFIPLMYLSDPKQKIVSATSKKGTKIYMRRGTMDKSMYWETWSWNFYKDSDLEIKPGTVVVDIGAQIGVFSLFAAEKVGKKGKVFSFEPMPENFKLLSKNIEENGLTNVYAFNQGVWKKRGNKKLYIYKLNSGGHSMYGVVSKKFVEMKTTTLSDVVKKVGKIDYLKIDAEGAEYDIILNTPSKVFKKIDKIILEYHDYLIQNHDHEEIVEFLKENGYKTKIGGSGNPFIRGILKQGIIKAYRD